MNRPTANPQAASHHSPVLGVALIFGLTWTVGLALAAQSRGIIPELVPSVAGILIGYLVVAGAILATYFDGGWAAVRSLLLRFTIWRVSSAWYVVALLGFPALYAVALGIYAAVTGNTLDFGSPAVTKFVPAGLSLLIVAPAWLVYEVLTNGEEIGWRGYLLPRLQSRYTPLIATLLVAVVWSVWHFPKFLVVPATYAYPLWIWALDTFAKAVIVTWLFNNTRGSLLLVTLFHASWNTASLCLPILPTSNGDVRQLTIAVVMTAVVAVALVVIDPQLGLRRAGMRSPDEVVAARLS